MRYLTAALALAACASDPDSTPYAGTNDASVTQCPLIGQPGYAGAYGLPDGQCAYRCTSTHRICGLVLNDRLEVTDHGTCVAYSDRNNCGACGVRCASGETCRVPAINHRGEYFCLNAAVP